jgi:hypothetical protein
MIRGSLAASRGRVARSRAKPAAARTSTASSPRGNFRSWSRDSSVPPRVRDRSPEASAASNGSVEAGRAREANPGDAEPAAGAASAGGRTPSSASSEETRGNQGPTGLPGVARETGDRSAKRAGVGGRADAGATAFDVRTPGPVPELRRTERPSPCGVASVGDTALVGSPGPATADGRVSTEAAAIAAGADAACCEGSARGSGG